MSLSKILSLIKDTMNHEAVNVVFIGIGTAAHTRNEKGILDVRNYHQYPELLRNIRRRMKDMNQLININIILIDPMQEDPPYMVDDLHLDTHIIDIPDMNGGTDEEEIKIYTSSEELVVFTIRKNVFTDPQSSNCRTEDYVNITEDLRNMTEFAKVHDVAFIYNEFTGRSNKVVAEYFDDSIKGHLNHIIFGFDVRDNFGCFLDLTGPCSNLPFYLTRELKLRLFNLHHYINTGTVSEIECDIQRFYRGYNQQMFDAQKEKIIESKKSYLKNVILQHLRYAYFILNGKDMGDLDLTEWKEFNEVSQNVQQKCINLLNEKKYQKLFDLLKNEYGQKLDLVPKLKNMDITGAEIIEFITNNPDPYFWYNKINDLI